MRYRYEVTVETRWGRCSAWYTDDLEEAFEHARRGPDGWVWDSAERRYVDLPLIVAGPSEGKN